MPYAIGFDRDKYIQMQSEHIQARRAEVGGKLYLEMGGKLFDDNHASRVLPGFTPDNKIAMLDRIKDEIEIIICFNAGDVVRQKMRADLGITYEDDVLRLVDVFRERGFLVENVVCTQLEGRSENVEAFLERLGRRPVEHSDLDDIRAAEREPVALDAPAHADAGGRFEVLHRCERNPARIRLGDDCRRQRMLAALVEAGGQAQLITSFEA